jgi:hypothetical protein
VVGSKTPLSRHLNRDGKRDKIRLSSHLVLTNDGSKILDVLPARAHIVVHSREFIAPYIRNVWLIWLIVKDE